MRRTLVMAAAIGVLVAIAIAGSASAAKEDRPDPFPVTETNVDENGSIKVHEQGTVKVDITNPDLAVSVDTSTPLDVNVANVPTVELASASSVELGSDTTSLLEELRDILATPSSAGPLISTVTRTRDIDVEDVSVTNWFFPDTLVTTLVISSPGDKIVVNGYSNGSNVLEIGHVQRDWPSVVTIPFPAALSLDQFRVFCGNHVIDCDVNISIIGLAPAGE